MTRRRKILLYVAFGVFSLLFSLVLTFPWAVLGRLIETRVAENVPGAALTINRIGPSLPFGVYLGNVVYQLPSKDPDNSPSVKIDAIRLKPAWLQLLTFKPGVAFDVEALGGEVSGKAWQSGVNSRFLVNAQHVQFDNGDSMEKLLGVQLQGTLTGKLDATISPSVIKGGLPTVSDGSLTATIDGARIKGGKVMGFALPATDLGSPEVALTITKGEAKIDKCETKSSDIELSVTGSVTLHSDLMQSPVRGALKMKPSDSWLGRNATIKSLISMAGPFRKTDGSLGVPLAGTLARPVSFPGFGF